MKRRSKGMDTRSAKFRSRRRFLKAGALALPAALRFLRVEGAAAQRPADADDAGTLERIWRQNAAPNPYILLRGGVVISMDPKVGDAGSGAGASPSDRRFEHDHSSGIRGRSPACLGRPTPAHHSERRHCRLHGHDTSGFCSLLSAARHVCRQPDHRARLHRCRDHMHHRQLAQLAFVRTFRCRHPGAHRFRNPRRSCVRRAADGRLGSTMASRPTAFAKALFLLRRSTGDAPYVFRHRSGELGVSPPARA